MLLAVARRVCLRGPRREELLLYSLWRWQLWHRLASKLLKVCDGRVLGNLKGDQQSFIYHVCAPVDAFVTLQ